MELSILDIAKRAGVSKSTVSRVINGGSVSPSTKELVEQTMAEMGYSPNYMARALRGVHTNVVGSCPLAAACSNASPSQGESPEYQTRFGRMTVT